MAKEKKAKKKRPSKYDEKLAIKGSFADVIKIAAHTNKKEITKSK